MLTKRNGVFETNSSSTHSIIVAREKDGDFMEHLPDHITFDVGEFGWEFARYQTLQERANYWFTGLFGCELEDMDKYLAKAKEVLSKWGIEAEFPELIKKTGEYTKEDYYDIEGKKSWLYWVDHSYNLRDWYRDLYKDETLFMTYLFSNESFIATGNDNSDEELDTDTNAEVIYEYDKGN